MFFKTLIGSKLQKKWFSMVSDFQKLYVYDPVVNSIISQMNSEKFLAQCLLAMILMNHVSSLQKRLKFSQMNIGIFTISTLFRHLNLMEWANSLNTDQTADLGLLCLVRPVCPNS